ncbi:MAG: hypothetical protein JNM34_01620 [Chthonomonadaceae bacterium]|nr:hypothetical protein [Chthonomonadaceae bacterium]
MREDQHFESWKKMVLRSMPSPAWLGADNPEGDIVISTRIRYARSLRGFRFPHHASNDDLKRVQSAVRSASKGLKLDQMNRMSEAERDFLLGSRLISPDFQHREPGRALLLDESRTVSVMVNEEDHLRLQALTPGWSLPNAQVAADHVLDHLSDRIQFMSHPRFGFLTASPYNAGEARRRSALFHLIGLAHTKHLPSVLKALAAWDLTARGLFGETSRAVGAFFQVSATRGDVSEFRGACEYLIQEERRARREVTRDTLHEKTRSAIQFAVASMDLSLAEALRVFAWVRWSASAGLTLGPVTPRDVDLWVSSMEVHGTQDSQTAARQRAVFVRNRVEYL